MYENYIRSHHKFEARYENPKLIHLGLLSGKDVKKDFKTRQTLKTATRSPAVTPAGHRATREPPPTDPGVVPFGFQLRNFCFSCKKLLPACL